MRHVVAALLAAFVTVRPACGADPALIRTHLASTAPVWVGQRATVVVDLLVSTTFVSVPGFDLPQIPGAVLMEIPEPPTLGTETVDGSQYVQQRHELGFWALRPGRFQIPAFIIPVASPESPGSAPVEHRLTTEPLVLEAKMPPGASDAQGLVSTTELRVREEWQPMPGDQARVGDAFVRTVTRTAPDVPGMVFPPLPLARVEGLAAYPAPPVVRDRAERGDFTGERVERITYVCERPGPVSIPALRIPWWNVAQSTLETATLPAVSMHIAGAPVVRGGRWRWLAAIATLLALAVALECWWRRRDPHPDDEAERFARLEAACHADDAPGAYNALLAWLDVTRADGRAATIEDDLLARHPDDGLRREVQALDDAVLRGDARWDGAQLEDRLRRARRTWRGGLATAAPVLPALNPR
jgi:hypothetical protein